MSTLDADRLIAACADDAADAGVRIRTELESIGGPDAKVKPATYAGGVFQLGRRWWGEGDGRRAVDFVTIDNEPSQANRLEDALERNRETLGLPEFVLDLSDLEPLPPHVPRRLSSFRFPHRNADAYLRDAQLDGTDFLKTDIGKAVFAATGDSADALFAWMPQALLFGFWQSHLGKKGSQAKLARAWTSEVIGIEPASGTGEDRLIRTEGLKGDPYNLVKEGLAIEFDPDDLSDWSVSEVKAGSSVPEGKRVSKIGHGQVPVGSDERALAGISFRSIVQQSSVSLAMLRRVVSSAAQPEGRAVLVALGLVAHVQAFGRSFHLRSGCDLRPVAASWKWLGAEGDEELEPMTTESAVELFSETVRRAEAAGLPVGSAWPEPLDLTPKDNLRKVIRNTFPEPDAA